MLQAEDKKARGEATGPLPVPSVAPKRRYEATPSTIVPRPLAPHGELIAEADEARFAAKNKGMAMSPQPMPMSGRSLLENERGSTHYPPLAQASGTPGAPVALGDDSTRGMRNPAPPHRRSGPPLGFFTDKGRESSLLPHGGAHGQEIPISSRHTPGGPIPPELARMDPFMSAQQPPSLLPTSHSRHPSLAQTPGSPPQLSRPEAELSSVHRDPFGQRQYYSIPGQPMGHSQSPRPVLSPVKDATSRSSVTPAPESAPRQVPAKRSNIMSILNDEPEEPQPPRKRFASEAPTPLSQAPVSSSRSVYQTGGPSRADESPVPGVAKSSGYGAQSQYPAPSRGYADYATTYGPPGGAGAPGGNDWMARFDPRAQQAASQPQSQPPQPTQQSRPSAASVGPPSTYPHYSSATPHSGHLSSLPVPSPAPTPPPASQRSYSTVFPQPAATQGSAPSNARDLSGQAAYRPPSPPSRAASVAFGSRQEAPTPAQPSAGLYGIPTRQPSVQPFSPATPSTPAPASHNQSYQQHVQGLVNGSHGSHRSTPVSLSGGHPSYGHSTPPPQNGRSMPSLAALGGRSYTPPSAMPHSLAGSGMGYAPSPAATGPAPVGLHQRPPGSGSLNDPGAAPGHHRVYSQGSAQGGLPGPLHPSSQPPR